MDAIVNAIVAKIVHGPSMKLWCRSNMDLNSFALADSHLSMIRTLSREDAGAISNGQLRVYVCCVPTVALKTLTATLTTIVRKQRHQLSQVFVRVVAVQHNFPVRVLRLMIVPSKASTRRSSKSQDVFAHLTRTTCLRRIISSLIFLDQQTHSKISSLRRNRSKAQLAVQSIQTTLKESAIEVVGDTIGKIEDGCYAFELGDGCRVRFVRAHGEWSASVEEKRGHLRREYTAAVRCQLETDIENALSHLMQLSPRVLRSRIHIFMRQGSKAIVFIGKIGLNGGAGVDHQSNAQPQEPITENDDQSESTEAPRLRRTTTANLADFAQQQKITSLKDLVEALNRCDQAEQKAVLFSWISRVVRLFSDKSASSLSLDQGSAIKEYVIIAAVVPESTEHIHQLREVIRSLCRKLFEDRLFSVHFLDGLHHALQLVDIRALESDTVLLTDLCLFLVEKINPRSCSLSEATFEKYAVALRLLHRALQLAARLDPNKWNPNYPDGLSMRFITWCGDLMASTDFYGVHYYASLIRQCLGGLQSQQLRDRRVNNGRRTFEFFQAVSLLSQTVRGLIVFDFNLRRMLSICHHAEQALRSDIVDKREWYDLHQTLETTCLQTIQNAKLFDIFLENLHYFQQNQRAFTRGEELKALRYAVIGNLGRLTLYGPTAKIRQCAMSELIHLAWSFDGKSVCWIADTDIGRELLNTLTRVTVQAEATLRDEALTALEVLHDCPSANHPISLTLNAWLNGQTMQERLSVIARSFSRPRENLLFDEVMDMLQKSKERRLSTQPMPLKRRFLYPPPLVPYFVGRQTESDEIVATFRDADEGVVMKVVSGQGGIGKSQLAIHAFTRLTAELDYAYAFWINSQSNRSLRDAFVSIAKHVGLNIEALPPQEFVRSVVSFLNEFRCLYVFDDACDSCSIREYIPPTNGHILITSRNSGKHSWRESPLVLQPFEDTEAIDLAHEFGHATFGYDYEAAKGLLERLPKYPLSLAQFFSSMANEGINATRWLASLNTYDASESDKQLIRFLETRQCIVGEQAKGMVFMFKSSLDRMLQASEHEGTAAVQMLSELAYLDPTGIPVEWIFTWSDDDDSMFKTKTRRVLAYLERYSFIAWKREQGQVYVHTDTQLMSRQLIDPSLGNRGDIKRKIVESMKRYVGPFDEHIKNEEAWASFLPHGRSIIKYLDPEYDTKLALDLARHLSLATDIALAYEESLEWAKVDLHLCRGYYRGRDHPSLAWSIRSVGVALEKLGFVEEAMENYQDAYSMYRRIYGDDDHPDVAVTIRNIGVGFHKLGHFSESMESYLEALAMYERIHDHEDHPDVAWNIRDVGIGYEKLKHYDEALEYFERSLAMQHRIHGDVDHPDLAEIISLTGGGLENLDRVEEALTYYESALAMYKSIHGEKDHPEVAWSLRVTGVGLEKLDRYEEAIHRFEAALGMYKRIHCDSDHPDVAVSLHNVGVGFEKLKLYTRALYYYEIALAMYERIYGNADHLDYAATIMAVGSGFENVNQVNDAIDHYQRALLMYGKIHGDIDHPDIISAVRSIGLALLIQQKVDHGIDFLKQMLEMASRLYAPESTEAVLCCQTLVASVQDIENDDITDRVTKSLTPLIESLTHVY